MRALATVVILAACGRVHFEPAPDAPPPTPTVRVVSQAYWTSSFGPEVGTSGMSMTGYELDAPGVVDGELLVAIACIDNGSMTTWPDPLGPGFVQLDQRFWGNDGQTCAVDWKIASGEPAMYTGVYGPNIVSGSALLVLLAIDGAAPSAPIADRAIGNTVGAGVNPVTAVSPGVTAPVANTLVLYATGSDWECFQSSNVTFTVPSGFAPLFASTDRGGTDHGKDWTTFQVVQRALATPGPTGTITSTETSDGPASCVATPWTAALAIVPPS